VSVRAKRVLSISSVVVIVNFFAFLFASLYLGGDALNGHVRDAHYFVCAHGRCSEVSQSIWNYSYWHAVTAFSGIALMFVELGVFVATGDIVLKFSRRYP
jgi:hypothetical protein